MFKDYAPAISTNLWQSMAQWYYWEYKTVGDILYQTYTTNDTIKQSTTFVIDTNSHYCTVKISQKLCNNYCVFKKTNITIFSVER